MEFILLTFTDGRKVVVNSGNILAAQAENYGSDRTKVIMTHTSFYVKESAEDIYLLIKEGAPMSYPVYPSYPSYPPPYEWYS